MRRIALSLVPFALVALSGCETPVDANSPMAEMARTMVAEDCEVGTIRVGSPSTTKYIRVPKGQRQHSEFTVYYRHPIDADRVSVYSLEALYDGWMQANLATGKVRDSFYFNPRTGHTACSYYEWHGPTGIRINLSGQGKPTIDSVTGN